MIPPIYTSLHGSYLADMRTPKGLTGTWMQAKGGKGEANGRRNAARGVETSVRGWRVMGMSNVHVDIGLHRERRGGGGGC